MLVSIASKNVNIVIIGIEDDGLVRSKFISVLSDGLPSVEVSALSCLHSIRITAFTLILLILGLELLLVDPDDIEAHASYFSSSIFEPADIFEAIDIETVLLSITFEKFGLRQNIILSFFLLFFIDKLSIYACLVARFRQVWWHSDEILVALRSTIFGLELLWIEGLLTVLALMISNIVRRVVT